MHSENLSNRCSAPAPARTRAWTRRDAGASFDVSKSTMLSGESVKWPESLISWAFRLLRQRRFDALTAKSLFLYILFSPHVNSFIFTLKICENGKFSVKASNALILLGFCLTHPSNSSVKTAGGAVETPWRACAGGGEQHARGGYREGDSDTSAVT